MTAPERKSWRDGFSHRASDRREPPKHPTGFHIPEPKQPKED